VVGCGGGVLRYGLRGAGAGRRRGWRLQRAEHLKRGVNLSSFYAQTRDLSQARLDAYMSVADMQALKAMGFDHVRLSINPALLIASPKTGTLRAGADGATGQDGGQLLDAGLNVILDIHAEEDWKAALTHGDDGASSLYAFWGTLRGTMRRAIRSACSSRF
jgi:endoglucanase